MIEWKIGRNCMTGYLLKIQCLEDVKVLAENEEEKAYRLVLFKKGTAIININGKSIAVTSPCVFCLSDRDKIIWKNQNSEYEMDLIYLHPSVVNHLFNCDNVVTGDFNEDWTTSVSQDRFLLLPFFDRTIPHGGILSIEINTFNRMLLLFDKLKNQLILEADCFWPCRSRSYLIEILIILQMRFMDNEDPEEFLELNESQKEVDDILNFIHSNYSSKITIELITKQFSINRNSLNERFTKLTGYAPISYLILHRLKVAESLLVNTSVPVYEICERVGFSELSNFMKSFKKRYGHTPANYRTLYTLMPTE